MRNTTPPSELFIVRHGEAHCNREGIIGGRLGCRGLTDCGRHQIKALARRLAQRQDEHPIRTLFTSPLRRARESAVSISGFLGIPAIVVEDLAEQDHGSGDGRPWVDVVAEFGDIPARHPDRPLVPNGESWLQYLDRSGSVLEQLLAEHRGERILIVGHGETIDSAFHYFFGLHRMSKAVVAVTASNASITTWQQQPISWTRPQVGLRWVLTTCNDTRHLDHFPMSHHSRTGWAR
ncbi:histidine phosphatase family protein [Nocardia sp. NPDC004068]|uniref:histidine phosphatase family protein n=1 Tax=Nocardia sp. NPDC004068 TaxID=3364303 RepID=UPI00367BFBFA